MPGIRCQKNVQLKTRNDRTKATSTTPTKTTQSKKTTNPPAPGVGKRSNQQEATDLVTKEKRQKTWSLTTADIPDIMSAVMKALPMSDAETTLHTTWSCWTTGNDTRPIDKQPYQCHGSGNQQESSSSESGNDADSKEFDNGGTYICCKLWCLMD